MTFYKKSTGRAGAVVVLVAICLVGVLTVVAIAIDGGMQLEYRRRCQATADAAAMAAACDIFIGNSIDTAKTSARTTASLCGYSNDGTTNSVAVNIPPLAGDHIGDDN